MPSIILPRRKQKKKKKKSDCLSDTELFWDQTQAEISLPVTCPHIDVYYKGKIKNIHHFYSSKKSRRGVQQNTQRRAG